MAKDKPITIDAAVLKLQLSLLEGIRHESQLSAAASLISRNDYEHVVEERSIENLCGYPLCPNSLPSDRPRKGRYRISLKEHKVYDLQETYKYCSTACIVSSRTFSETLEPERFAVTNSGKINEVLKLFGELGLADDAVLGKNGDLEFSDLKIEEKLDVKMANMSLDDWIGPSNAIEGYVPLIDRKLKLAPPKRRENESKHKSAKRETGKGKFVNESNFTSSIIMGDPFSVSALPSTVPLGDCSELSSLRGNSQFGIPEMLYDSVENVHNGDVKVPKKEVLDEKKEQLNKSELKSSLKSSVAKQMTRSVTWADEKKPGSVSKVKSCEVQETSDTPENDETSSSSNRVDVDGSVRLASAEACAFALTQASEAVAFGDTDVTDAVSEAGIVILSQPQDADGYCEKDEAVMDEDMVETDLVPLKWPKKPGVLDSEVFDAEYSWYESPPEGFSLALSPFATMYMALFGWITSSSLSYIYGQDYQSDEEFLFVNGREYPRKIVLSDGRSSEIKLTLAGCLSRALPKVATDLRLKIPTFTIEKEVGHLLNTMSFTDALPSFKLKQWHVIVLLFVDALSVCRIPGLAPHMTTGRILLQKVLDGAQVSGEEYEIMKDLLIPLGRVPQFSAQSGA